MSEKNNEGPHRPGPAPANSEILTLTADFALRANPHVKFVISDVNDAWAKLPHGHIGQIEDDLVASRLFIVFDKKGKMRRFLLKDSVRVDLIAAGSYEGYRLTRKSQAEMNEQELALAGPRDEKDNQSQQDRERVWV